ncbi:MAG TPA: hypothetical protein VJK02_21200 [Anaerolineales bacterium]|nr:hypothetical protein [Anaerolineales bacterium]
MKRTREQLLRIVAIQAELARHDHTLYQPFGGPAAHRSFVVAGRYERLLWDLATNGGRETREDIDTRQAKGGVETGGRALRGAASGGQAGAVLELPRGDLHA